MSHAEPEILPPEPGHRGPGHGEPGRSESRRGGGPKSAGRESQIWLKFGADDRARFVFARPSPLALILTWLIIGGVAAAILFLAFGAMVIGALAIGAIAGGLILTGAVRDVVRRLRAR